MLQDKLGNSPIDVVPLDPIIPGLDWYGLPVPKIDWVIESLIPVRQVTLLTGQGGAGKSFLTLTLLAAVAKGEPWLGHITAQGYALGFYCEDERDILHKRVSDLCQIYQIDLESLTEMELHERVGQESVIASFNRYNGEMAILPFFQQVRERIKSTGAKLVVLDNLYDMFDGNENERVHARRFMKVLAGLAKEMNCAIVVCAHPSRQGITSGDGYSGSTAWRDSVRSLLYLTFAKDDAGNDDRSRLQLVVKKMNHAVEGSTYDLTRIHGVPVYEPPLGLESGATGQMISRNAKRAFLECMKVAEEKGIDVGTNLKASNYAPQVLLKFSVSRGLNKKQFEAAMYQLLESDFLVVSKELNEHRKQRDYLRLTEKGKGGYDEAVYR